MVTLTRHVLLGSSRDCISRFALIGHFLHRDGDQIIRDQILEGSLSLLSV